jgi:hypothetical protein
MGASLITKNPPTKTTNTFHLIIQPSRQKEMFTNLTWNVACFFYSPQVPAVICDVVMRSFEKMTNLIPQLNHQLDGLYLLYKSSSMDGNEWSWWFNQTISQICSHMLLANGVRKLKLPRFLPLLTTIIIGLILKLGCRKNSLISFLEMTNVCMNLKSPILRKKQKFAPSN